VFVDQAHWSNIICREALYLCTLMKNVGKSCSVRENDENSDSLFLDTVDIKIRHIGLARSIINFTDRY